MDNFYNFIIVKAEIEHQCGFRGEATWKFDKTWESISIDDIFREVDCHINRCNKDRKIIGPIQILIDYEKYLENEKEKYADKAVKITIK
jgi:N-glycosylase/DNA lyase